MIDKFFLMRRKYNAECPIAEYIEKPGEFKLYEMVNFEGRDPLHDDKRSTRMFFKWTYNVLSSHGNRAEPSIEFSRLEELHSLQLARRSALKIKRRTSCQHPALK